MLSVHVLLVRMPRHHSLSRTRRCPPEVQGPYSRNTGLIDIATSCRASSAATCARRPATCCPRGREGMLSWGLGPQVSGSGGLRNAWLMVRGMMRLLDGWKNCVRLVAVAPCCFLDRSLSGRLPRRLPHLIGQRQVPEAPASVRAKKRLLNDMAKLANAIGAVKEHLESSPVVDATRVAECLCGAPAQVALRR